MTVNRAELWADMTTGVFHREGEYWTMEYEKTLIRLRDSKGLRYLACLLSAAGQTFTALDLYTAVENGIDPIPRGPRSASAPDVAAAGWNAHAPPSRSGSTARLLGSRITIRRSAGTCAPGSERDAHVRLLSQRRDGGDMVEVTANAAIECPTFTGNDLRIDRRFCGSWPSSPAPTSSSRPAGRRTGYAGTAARYAPRPTRRWASSRSARVKRKRSKTSPERK